MWEIISFRKYAIKHLDKQQVLIFFIAKHKLLWFIKDLILWIEKKKKAHYLSLGEKTKTLDIHFLNNLMGK